MTIPFTLTFHPHNNPVKAIILNNFKILQNDPETGAIFWQPPLVSFKRDKNVAARAKMSLSRAQNIFMPANINSIVIFSGVEAE